MLTNKWFSKSSDITTGVTQNERFADRLNSVWIKFPRNSRLRPGKVISGFARLGKFLMDLNERVNKLEEAAKPKDTIRIPSIEEGVMTGRYAPERLSEAYQRTSSAGRTATGVLASSNEALLRKFRLPPYVAPTTADRAVSLISAVLDGKVVSATIRQAGLRITVEKDNE